MYTRFNTNYANKGEWQIILYVGNQTYDWDDGFPSTHSGNLIVSANTPASINAGLRIINNGEIDQTHLAGTDIAITLQATSLSCTAVEAEIEYFNASNENSPLHSPGNMPYYIKQTSVNSNVILNELCGAFNREVCLRANDWNNINSYYTMLTTAGASCSYSDDNNDGINDILQCQYDTIQCELFDNGYVILRTTEGEQGACSISSSGVVFCELR